jgi:cytochrome c oxidase cbb3-type subunit I/II
MPAYGHIITNDLDFDGIQKRVDGMAMLGVPYGDAINKAPDMARAQAKTIAADLATTGGGAGFETKEVTALIAYIQRLGKDIQTAPGTVASRNAANAATPVTAPVVAPAGGHP